MQMFCPVSPLKLIVMQLWENASCDAWQLQESSKVQSAAHSRGASGHPKARKKIGAVQWSAGPRNGEVICLNKSQVDAGPPGRGGSDSHLSEEWSSLCMQAGRRLVLATRATHKNEGKHVPMSGIAFDPALRSHALRKYGEKWGLVSRGLALLADRLPTKKYFFAISLQ
jgi:hypothetical protein